MPIINDDFIVGRPLHEIIENEAVGQIGSPGVLASKAQITPLNAVRILHKESETAISTSIGTSFPPTIDSRVIFNDATYEKIVIPGFGTETVSIIYTGTQIGNSVGVIGTSTTQIIMRVTRQAPSFGVFDFVLSSFITGIQGFTPRSVFLVDLNSTWSISRIDFIFPGAEKRELTRVMVGDVLNMTRQIYVGHTPSRFARDTKYQTQVSETGEWLGRSAIRRGLSNSFEFTNLDPSFVRSQVDPFIVHAQTKPFFIAWRPFQYFGEVMFAWAENDIRPQNQSPNGLMSLSFECRGYAKR